MSTPVDYTTLLTRWQDMMRLPSSDYEVLFSALHPEVSAGILMIARIAAENMEHILSKGSFSKTKDYVDTAQLVLQKAVLEGYSLFLLTQGINPTKENLKTRKTTHGVGAKWAEAVQKDETKSYLDRMDLVAGLLLSKMYEANVNHLIATVPQIVELPYKITEGLNHYVDWAGHQGFILGMMEQELHKS